MTVTGDRKLAADMQTWLGLSVSHASARRDV